MSSLPKYSRAGKLALAQLYTPYNDIAIYVEDVSLEHLYLKIFNRLFNKSIKIRRIFPLGGKGEIIRTIRAYRNGKLDIPEQSFFIVDRDLDPFLTDDMFEDELLIYLKKYCIENYLIEEFAVVNALQWKLNKIPEELKDEVNFETWLNSVKSELFDLFVAFVLCRKYSFGESVQLSPFKFLENNGYKVDELKVNRYILELEEKYIENHLGSNEDFQHEFRTIKEFVGNKSQNISDDFISGKYLLASLLRYASSICKKGLDQDMFTGHLVENFQVSNLDFIKEKILSAVS